MQPEQRYERLEEIWSRLNEKELSPIENKNDIVVGAVVAAPYFEAFYRAKILSYSSKANKYRIYFIDWGNR